MARRDLNLLAALDELLRERNVTRAAQKLNLTQPTLSGMLKRLRDRFDDPLLVRVGRDYELTPRAEAIAEQLHQALLSLDSILVATQSFDVMAARRHFVIMASEISSSLLLPELSRRAAAAAPNLTFEIRSIFNAIESVYRGKIDLCMVGGPIANVEPQIGEAIHTQVLFSDQFVCIVHRDHPAGATLSRAEYEEYPHVTVRFAGAPATQEEQAIGSDSLVQPRIVVPSFAAVGPFLADRRTIAVAPSRILSFIEGADALRAVGSPAPLADIKLRMLWHVRHDGDRAHRWLREQLTDIAARLDPI